MQTPSKSAGFLPTLTLVIIAAVLAISVTFTQTISGVNPTLSLMNFDDIPKSFSLSMVLILIFCISAIIKLTAQKIKYLPSHIELGMLVFTAALLISSLFASDKRSAITGSLIIISAMLTCLVLVNLLTTPARIKFLLVLITSLGLLNSFVCIFQFANGNKQMTEMYQQDPKTMLDNLGIEQNTLEQFMFEHRLNSPGVKGYFLTGNSAASYFILSAAACAILILQNRNCVNFKFAFSILAFIVILAGLILTRSKGGIASALFATMLFAIYKLFPGFIAKHKKMLTLLVILTLIIASDLVISYGIKNQTLPGGNSMLVRWQYWQSTAKMITENPLGVGSGNFGTHYTKYKIPASPETVNDPHNFILSLIANYGWIGLLGFFAALGGLFIKAFSSHTKPTPIENQIQSQPIGFGLFIATCTVTFIGWFFTKSFTLTDNLDIAIFLILFFYLFPISIIIITGYMLWQKTPQQQTSQNIQYQLLICGVAGFLVHNLIDFAIFEPGIWLTLWAILAIIIAGKNLNRQTSSNITLPAFARLPLIITALAIIIAAIIFAYIPVLRTAHIQTQQLTKFKNIINPKINIWPGSQNQVYTESQLDNILQTLQNAFTIDKLDPSICHTTGKLAMTASTLTGMNKKFINSAISSFQLAISRDPANHKAYDNLARSYIHLSRIENERENLEHAKKNLKIAVSLYPGSGKLHFQYANVSEALGQREIAIEHYLKSIEIENAFRKQFKIMYPDHKPVSRLGQDKYEIAQRRLTTLLDAQ